MKSYFKQDAIVLDLPGILLLSHGDLALGMLDTLRLVVENVDNIAAFTLEAGDNPEEYQAAFLQALEALPGPVLVFTDMMSGSPCNQLMLLSGKIVRPFHAFAGMNLPTVTEAVFMRQVCNGEELREAVMAAAQISVVDIKQAMAELEEEDDE